MNGTPLPAESLEGVRVEGPVTLLEAEGGRCWAVRYDDGAGEVESPLLAPPGYTDDYAVMADPSRPGEDIEGATLLNPDGEIQGFADTGVMVAAEYRDALDVAIADAAAECGWNGPVLVADEPHGVSVDPDGIDSAVRICHFSGDEMPDAGQMAGLLDECEVVPSEDPVP